MPQVAAASGASQQKVRFSESLVQSRKFHIGVLLVVVLMDGQTITKSFMDRWMDRR